MIKHEEVRESLELMRADVTDFRDIIDISSYSSDDDYKRIVNYIAEQEKKDKLLELYREKEKLAHNPYNNTTNEIRPFYEWACELSSLETKIRTLEEELK